jgi:uncharacterized GH25 family protein
MVSPLFNLRASMALVILLFGGVAHAHFPWLAVVAQTGGAALSAQVMFGHGPADAAPLPAARLEHVRVMDAEGRIVTLQPNDAEGTEHLAPDLDAPPVMVLALQQPGFWSRKVEGGERLPRNEVPDALGCVCSRNSMKALLSDGADSVTQQTVGHPLEILPRGGLEAGPENTRLRVAVRFGDQPYAGRLSLVALEEGGPKPTLFDADASGTFEITVPSPGAWMLYARTTTPYPDPAVCDENGYNATLVFAVPPR